MQLLRSARSGGKIWEEVGDPSCSWTEKHNCRVPLQKLNCVFDIDLEAGLCEFLSAACAFRLHGRSQDCVRSRRGT